MKINIFLLISITTFWIGKQAFAQSYAFGIKGGMTAGTQKWDNNFQREPLFRYHIAGFIESHSDQDKFSVFAQAGYHIKGSSIRTFAQVIQTPTGFQSVDRINSPFEFNNISLVLGGKQKYDFRNSTKVYYSLGIRGDYTISSNLRPEGIDETNSYFFVYPFDEFVNKFNYGVTAGGGIQFDFTDLIGGFLEIQINPDFSYQYNQPEIRNVRNPNPLSSTSSITIPQRQITNTTIELSLGFRFLHKIIYVN
ncbi:MAG: outer membrane beta-barrel protein [Saprospiraceae bacterium]|jgi:hypothetical protein